jgi:hypothetical protein
LLTPDDRTLAVERAAPDATEAVPRTTDRTSALPVHEPTMPARQAPPARARRSRAPIVFLVVALLVIALSALAWYLNDRNGNGTAPPGNEQPLPGPVQDAFDRLEQLVQR